MEWCGTREARVCARSCQVWVSLAILNNQLGVTMAGQGELEKVG